MSLLPPISCGNLIEFFHLPSVWFSHVNYTPFSGLLCGLPATGSRPKWNCKAKGLHHFWHLCGMLPSYFKRLNFASQIQDKIKMTLTHLKKWIYSSEAPKPFLPRTSETRLKDTQYCGAGEVIEAVCFAQFSKAGKMATIRNGTELSKV